jgi:hypothetical protein
MVTERFEINTGRTRTICGTDWPVVHLMIPTPGGWTITEDHCGGDAGMARRRTYKTRRHAMHRWRELQGLVEDTQS